MGLDFSHEVGRFSSYSGFNAFRQKLAGHLNGFDGQDLPGPDTLWNAAISGEFDPLLLLLCHSDCDGVLEPWACRVVAPALREVVESWDSGGEDEGWMVERGLALADGMDRAAEANEPLVFC